MKRVLRAMLASITLASSLHASAAGLVYAVSLERAKELVQVDASKHIMVFYTEAW